MTGQEVRRADEVLTELVELVETARSVPISGSCVIPREHTLDLLDDLREVLPPEMAEARRVVAQRDEILAAARAEIDTARSQIETERERAQAAAQEYTTSAEHHVADLISQGRTEAARLVDEGRAENARLISSAGVHEAALAAAEQLRAEGASAGAQARADADDYAARVRQEADLYAVALRSNADEYADRTLGEIVATLQRSAATAERGRAELAARRVPDAPADTKGDSFADSD